MKKTLKSIICVLLAVAVIIPLVPGAGGKVYAAKKSVIDIITDAAGTDGGITTKTKEYIVDRYALDDSTVSKTAGGWNDDTGAAVAVIKCTSKASAKTAVKKLKEYVKTNIEAAEAYGYEAGTSNPYLEKAYINRVGKYAILVMLSTDKANNKAGFSAAKKKL